VKSKICQKIEQIKKEIPDGVVLQAATKTRSVGEILEAISGGIEVIGENYVQEAEKKYGVIGKRVKWHMIGHLQINKVKKAVKIFNMIETVDSVRLAEEINRRANKRMSILVEVNIGEEEQKSGVMPSKVEELLKSINNLENIRIRGLMTMAPYFEEAGKIRPYFRKMMELFNKLKREHIAGVEMEILSMGMSDTYKIAIEEGATMVRVGSAIFGQRQ
jgi:pyridoxal phosphate enzyme (YggS family)